MSSMDRFFAWAAENGRPFNSRERRLAGRRVNQQHMLQHLTNALRLGIA